jgi:hypothetical protein
MRAATPPHACRGLAADPGVAEGGPCSPQHPLPALHRGAAAAQACPVGHPALPPASSFASLVHLTAVAGPCAAAGGGSCHPHVVQRLVHHVRFQQSGPCLFGCSFGEDSVQHYAACRCVHRFASSSLRLADPGTASERRQAFMLLEAASDLPDQSLCLRALLVGATCRLHCIHRRRGGLDGEEAGQRTLQQAPV